MSKKRHKLQRARAGKRVPEKAKGADGEEPKEVFEGSERRIQERAVPT